MLATAPEQTLAEMKRTLRRAVIAADPDGAADRAEAARAERTVSRDPLDDGMAELRAVLTATDTELVWAELTARAQAEHIRRHDHGLPQPGLDALRADALVDAVLGTAPPPEGTVDTSHERRASGGTGRGRVQLRVTRRPAHPARPRRQPGRAGRARPHPARSWPASSPATPTGPGSPPTPRPANCSTSPPAATGPPAASPRSSAPANPSAAGPAATSPPNAATSTTPTTSEKAARPAEPTSARSAANTTTPKPTADGTTNATPTAAATLTSPLRKTYTLKPPWRRANQ